MKDAVGDKVPPAQREVPVGGAVMETTGLSLMVMVCAEDETGPQPLATFRTIL